MEECLKFKQFLCSKVILNLWSYLIDVNVHYIVS